MFGTAGTGPVYGVVDHCTITDTGLGFFAQDVRSADSAWGGIAWTDFLANEATYPGGNKFLFFEDNTITWDKSVNSGSGPGQGSLYGQYGGKVVYRHNDISNWSPLVDAHGFQASNAYGTIMYEIYNNTFKDSGAYTGYGYEGKVFYLRGGHHLIHDNQFNTSDIPVVLTVYNSSDPANQRIKDTFFWNNTHCNQDGVTGCSTNQSTMVSVETGPLTLNTDYFLRAPTTGDFGGLPSPYTPYTYPHPLQGTSTTLMPPTGLKASVN